MDYKTSDVEQNKRLDELLVAFLEESEAYKRMRVPNSIVEKRRLLRSLMNVRMPKTMKAETINLQDDYLKKRIEEKGIVEVSEIEEVKPVLSIWQGDIIRLKVDAIVNAANSQMLGCFVPMHTCIDNCIHTFAGIRLREECDSRMKELRKQYGEDYEQPTAVPMITDAYNLPARKVVHIVGPIVQNRLIKKQEQELADCYRNTLDLCLNEDLRTVAFCCISTGVFGFPNVRAGEIAVATVSEWIKEHPGKVERIIFNVFKDEDKQIYERLLR